MLRPMTHPSSGSHAAGRGCRVAAVALALPFVPAAVLVGLGFDAGFAAGLSLVMAGLLLLLACGIVWLIGLILLTTDVRRAGWRGWAWAAGPWAMATLCVLIVVGTPDRLRVFNPINAAARAYHDGTAAEWDAAAAEVRATVPADPDNYEKADWGRSIAGTRVDEVAHDAAGGVWFRTATRPDMIDQWSFGLHHRPTGYVPPKLYWDESKPTTPYGTAHLRLRRLGGGWYAFRVNDDW